MCFARHVNPQHDYVPVMKLFCNMLTDFSQILSVFFNNRCFLM